MRVIPSGVVVPAERAAEIEATFRLLGHVTGKITLSGLERADLIRLVTWHRPELADQPDEAFPDLGIGSGWPETTEAALLAWLRTFPLEAEAMAETATQDSGAEEAVDGVEANGRSAGRSERVNQSTAEKITAIRTKAPELADGLEGLLRVFENFEREFGPCECPACLSRRKSDEEQAIALGSAITVEREIELDGDFSEMATTVGSAVAAYRAALVAGSMPDDEADYLTACFADRLLDAILSGGE